MGLSLSLSPFISLSLSFLSRARRHDDGSPRFIGNFENGNAEARQRETEGAKGKTRGERVGEGVDAEKPREARAEGKKGRERERISSQGLCE